MKKTQKLCLVEINEKHFLPQNATEEISVYEYVFVNKNNEYTVTYLAQKFEEYEKEITGTSQYKEELAKEFPFFATYFDGKIKWKLEYPTVEYN